MTNRIHRSSCAFHAIAASLALCSTPLLAQEVSPAAPPAAAADPAPVIVLPAQPAAAPSAAAVQSVAPAPADTPAVNASNDQQARTKARNAPVARATAAPRVVRASPVVAIPAIAVAKPVSIAQLPITAAPSPITPAPDQAEPAVAPQPVAAQTSDNGSLLGLGALAALGIAGLGAFAARRRRRIVTEDEAMPIIDPIDSDATALVVTAPDYATYDLAETAEVASRGMTIPDGPVPTGEARQRLIDRMVAAAPDSTNPFTSAKGRRRRARLILQARENEQQLPAQDGFDWRNFQAPREPAQPVADCTTVDA